jgi:pyrimidine deaminase RibD-like protein
MNNTTTIALAAIVVILMSATLLVGATSTTKSSTAAAFAYKKDNGKGNGNGNTVTIEECKNRGSSSGFDTAVDQECENLICTHPDNNATCSQEGAATASAAATAKRTCEQCFTSILKPEQITTVLGPVSIARACATFDLETQIDFRNGLIGLGIPAKTADDLITCLLKAGIVFKTP